MEPNYWMLNANCYLLDLDQGVLGSLRRGRRLGCLEFPKRKDPGFLQAILDLNPERRQWSCRFERMSDLKK
jgi:hypothetical protein